MIRRRLVTAIAASLSFVLVGSTAGLIHANSSPLPSITFDTLAQGSVKSLPNGKIYLSILEFRQVPGSDFGPHAHQASIAYTVHGTDTISFPGAAAQSVASGQASFIPGQSVHTHQDLDGRIGAGAIAFGLIAAVVLLCAATWLRGGRRRITIGALSVCLIAGGALPLIGATSNDYYLIAVRPEVQRAGPMPRPDGHVFYASPDVDPVPAGPYIESLNAIDLRAGAQYEPPVAPGPQMIIVMDGTAVVRVGDQTSQLGAGEGTFAQAGQTLAITNSRSQDLRIIDFTVRPAAPAAP